DFIIDTIIDRMTKSLDVTIILFDTFKAPEAYSRHYRQGNALMTEHTKYFMNHYQDALTYDKNNLVFENKDHVIFKVLGYTYFPYYLMVSQVNKLSYPLSLLRFKQVVIMLSFILYKHTTTQEAKETHINK